jgi:hypothetical protein
VDIRVSNPQDFQIVYPTNKTFSKPVSRNPKNTGFYQIPLGSFEKSEIQVIFWPSSLSEKHSTRINTQSNIIGNQSYYVEV